MERVAWAGPLCIATLTWTKWLENGWMDGSPVYSDQTFSEFPYLEFSAPYRMIESTSRPPCTDVHLSVNLNLSVVVVNGAKKGP